jgi:hypothetical protein
MGNRHGNKQRRRAVIARMAHTGESYQQALTCLLARHEPKSLTRKGQGKTEGGVDLIPIHYFGAPSVLATFEIAGRLAVLIVSTPHGRGPFPQNPLIALGQPRAIN